MPVELPETEDPAFAAPFDRLAGKRVVLLGEASHGTSEFYRARAAITRRLIQTHGFDFVAVEADWPDAAVLDRWARGLAPPPGAETPFQRFPTWMWRNEEMAGFLRWLREHNGRCASPAARAGFHGLDLYNLHASMAAVLRYLEREDPDSAAIAKERYGCLAPWQDDPIDYGRAVRNARYGRCEAAVVAQCRELLQKRLSVWAEDGRGTAALDLLDAAQNARLVASAERYYRIAFNGGPEAWNLRDTHMFETLELLLQARGPGSRAVVWAHNSHIGDARRTEMGWRRGELNLGQLCRERFGADCALVGFGTHTGTVAAADDWDGAMQIKRVRPSQPESVERLCHDAGLPRFLLDLQVDGPLQRRLAARRMERFIGVIYRPHTELGSHYADVELTHQFDSWVWFDETRAVTALEGAERPRSEPPELWPYGE